MLNPYSNISVNNNKAFSGPFDQTYLHMMDLVYHYDS